MKVTLYATREEVAAILAYEYADRDLPELTHAEIVDTVAYHYRWASRTCRETHRRPDEISPRMLAWIKRVLSKARVRGQGR